MAEVSAGIAHGFIQPQLVEIVADIVVALYFFLIFLDMEVKKSASQCLLVCGELSHLAHEQVQSFVQVAFHLQVSVHIGFSQSQRVCW